VVIVPNPHYGYPSILAYKVLQAIMRKLSWFSYPMLDTVEFTQRGARAISWTQFVWWGESGEFKTGDYSQKCSDTQWLPRPTIEKRRSVLANVLYQAAGERSGQKLPLQIFR